jgi:hypothetical protein
MNIYDLTTYVNQDSDDTFSFQEVARWFNKAISNYNLIPPVTRYPFVTVDNFVTSNNNEFLDNGNFNNDAVFNFDAGDDEVGAGSNYPLSKTFMLGIILPFIVSSIKGQEASLQERQIYLQEFMMNARNFKSISNIPQLFLLNQQNTDLELYQLGENVYLTDFNTSPFAGDWKKATSYKEVTITRNANDKLVKYVDDSLIDEEV